MDRADRMVDYLRGQEVTEQDLYTIYTTFLLAERGEGFARGYQVCNDDRQKQSMARKKSQRKRFDEIYEYLDSLEPEEDGGHNSESDV